MKINLTKTVVLLLIAVLLSSFFSGAVFASSEKDFKNAMKNSVVMYINKPNVLLYGKKDYISQNREITPYKTDDGIFVPIDFFAKSINATVSSVKNNKATLTLGEISVKVRTQTTDDVVYADINKLCNAVSYNLSIQDNGLLAYSSQNIDALFDWTSNLLDIRKMLESFLFDDVSGEELYSRLTTNNDGNPHPRLLLSDEKIQTIRRALDDENGDEIYINLCTQIINSANYHLLMGPSVYEIRDGIRLLYVSWEASDVIVACSLAYIITGDEAYAKRAYDEMAAVCAFPDWNPSHYLDVGVMSAGVALGYDWIYNWMTAEQRATIRAGIEKHVIPTILEDINGCVGKRTYQWYKEGNANNWRCVCAGGVGVAMLSMMDEFEGETLEKAKLILPKMLEAMRPTMMLFAPSGAFEEGFAYWEFAMQNFTYLIKSLEMTTGSDYGYVDLPGMNMTSSYFVAANGPVQIFNYHNVGATHKAFYPAQLMYLADKFNTPETVKPVIERILSFEQSSFGKYDEILYYDPIMNREYDSQDSFDAYFPVSEIATMRNDDTFIGLHCDKPYGNGGTGGAEHMDAGQFQLQSNGEVWFMDLGSNGYNVSDLNNTYRFRAEGHNTVIFNPDSDYAMKKRGDVYISNFRSEENLSYAIAKMTDAYNKEEGVESFLRGVKFDKKSGHITIQDEIRLTDSADMYWFAHTDADIVISEDKKSATLTKNEKTLTVYIANGDAATFSVMEAKPLPTSPQVPDQDPVPENVKKLTIHIEECNDIDLCVVIATGETPIDKYKFSNISDWLHKGDETRQPTTSYNNRGAGGGFLKTLVCTAASVIAVSGAVALVVIKKKKKK